jgi:hypothetical protein
VPRTESIFTPMRALLQEPAEALNAAANHGVAAAGGIVPKNHARATAIRTIKRQLGIKHTEAIAVLDDPRCDDLCYYIEANELATYAEAVAVLEHPNNQILCEDCGWTVGMICPECPGGCGCYNGRCSGWRHSEYGDEPDPDSTDCPECGASDLGGYGCDC